MKFNLSKNSKAISLALFGGASSFTFYKYKNVIKDIFSPEIHPTKEYAEKLIKLDKRITNFCGLNYTISKFKIIENSDKYISYRMNLNGIRGPCKILVKVQKLDHEELKFINEQQKKIASMPYEERKREPFVPIDFNDILIPTKNTFDNWNFRLDDLERGIKIDNENKITDEKSQIDINYDKKMGEKFNYLSKRLQNKYNDSIKLQDSDTFYRFMNISVSYSDDVIFNIRPLTVRFRNYEIIDTQYNANNYRDILNIISKIDSDFFIKTNNEISAEEVREEMRVVRRNALNQRLEQRQKLFKYQVFLLMVGLLIARHHMNTVSFQKIYRGVSSNLKKNKNIKKIFGENYIVPYLNYRYNLFSKTFTFSCIVQQGNKKVTVEGKSLPNVDNVFPNLRIYDNNNKLINV